MNDQLEKIAQIRSMIESGGYCCDVEVDGGIDPHTAPLVRQAGANVLVAGSAVFHQADRAQAIAQLR